MSYSPPASIRDFTLFISDEALSEWRQLLQLGKLGPKTFENQQKEKNFGTTYRWMSEVKEYCLEKYDWRAQEERINSFPNYTVEVDGFNIHFVALFSRKQGSAIPILFLHGWPGSFVEFLPMCELIRNQYSDSELPYHIIIPSLPGYTLSSGPPLDRDFTLGDTAEVMSQLMQTLGFDKYIVQGGDVGSFVGRIMAERFDSVVGLHSNMFLSIVPPDPEKLNDLEKKAWSRSSEWFQLGRAYMQEQGTRPSTIGHVLSASPLALMAWIGEKFVEWSDETPPLDDILTNILLYWFTESFPRSIYPYRGIVGGGMKFKYLEKPTGFSFFPLELSPGIKYLIEADRNVVAYKQHEKGGHFAALEQPKELWVDVQEYVAKVWIPQ